ncbi:MAG: hypothetical protein IJZ68_06485 [Bacteroidaceae bacterium]|nr:hypothetical protein [Bacteroidaceae bacterium]
MGKEYYAVFQSSISKVNDGKFPERTGETVTFYAKAQEGMDAIKGMHRTALDCPPLGPNGARVALPCVAGIYRVELEPSDIAKMQDTTKTFSGGTLSGQVPKGSIIDTQWLVSADGLHYAHKGRLGETLNGDTPSHAAIQAVAGPRVSAFTEFVDAANRTREPDLERIDPRDPVTARALYETYSADGFMNKSPNTLAPEQAYCQQMMRFMVFDKPMNIAAQTDAFHQAYNAKLDALEAKYPNTPTSELAQKAMEGTIKDFRAAAEKSHGLREQRMFDEMQQANTACGTLMGKTHTDLVSASQTIVNGALEQPVGNIDFDGIIDRATGDYERDEMAMLSADDSFGEVDFDD